MVINENFSLKKLSQIKQSKLQIQEDSYYRTTLKSIM